jgi:hypothetical protein
MNTSYLIDRGDDVAERIQRSSQGADRKPDPLLDSALVSCLLLVINDEEC